MSLFDDIAVDELTPVRLWAALDAPTRALAARAVFEGDGEMRGQANHAIATTLNFRPAGVQKLSLDRRADYLARRVRPDDGLASSLLLALHLECRQPLLTAFLDALGVPNDDGLIDPDHELPPPTAGQLEPAVAAIREQFDHAEVDVYLASLLVLDQETWGALAETLQAATP
jgi:hypothetical protein